jgi:hypothetical protein
MNRRQADEVVGYIGRLWDGWQANVEQVQLWSDIFALDWLTVDAAKDIARKVRLASPYVRPAPVEFVKAIGDANRARLQALNNAKRSEDAAKDITGNRTLSEWKRWYTTEPDGKAEWNVLPGNVRRGLRIVFGLAETEDKDNQKRVTQ